MGKRLLLFVLNTGLIVLAVLGVISIFVSGVLPMSLTVLFLVISVLFFLWGANRIPHEKRRVVEFLGEFFGIYGPGFAWLFPFLLRVREQVPLSEQRFRIYNPETGHENTIDFKDGSAIPLGAFAFLQVKGARDILSKQAKGEPITKGEIKELNENIFRIVYAADNVKKQSITLIENLTRSSLNSMTIDEGITAGKAGYNLLDGMEKMGDQKIKDGLLEVRKSLDQWGAELWRVTIADFGLTQETIDARNLVLQKQKEAQAAEHEAQAISTETAGAKLIMLAAFTGKSVKEIQAEINQSAELRKSFDDLSTELLKLRMGYKAGRRTDIGVQGAEGGFKDILTILMAAKEAITDKKES